MEYVDNQSFSKSAVFQRRLLFWGIAPLLMALQHTLSLADMTFATRGVYFVYLWVVSLASWIINHTATTVVARYCVPKSWHDQRPRLIRGGAVLIVGGLLGGLTFMMTQQFRAQMYCHMAVLTGDSCYYPQPFSYSWTYLGHVTRLTLINLQCWLIVNYLVAYIFEVDRYGFTVLKRSSFQAQSKDMVSDSLENSSPLLSRIPFELGTKILALEGKQHYVQVHTDKGSDLVLYRLSDAMREMGDKGLQIHRSYWVAFDAITCVQKHNGAYKVVLSDSLSFPISRAFQHTLKTGQLRQFLTSAAAR